MLSDADVLPLSWCQIENRPQVQDDTIVGSRSTARHPGAVSTSGATIDKGQVQVAFSVARAPPRGPTEPKVLYQTLVASISHMQWFAPALARKDAVCLVQAISGASQIGTRC